MHIITRTRLVEFWTVHREAEGQLQSWETIVRKARWKNFADVKKTLNSTDLVRGEFLVFNAGSNRIVAHVHYEHQLPDGETANGTIFIRAVFTHDEYVAWSR